jgi:signal transduction histidine kinase/CheY-like chemotaxis protein
MAAVDTLDAPTNDSVDPERPAAGASSPRRGRPDGWAAGLLPVYTTTITLIGCALLATSAPHVLSASPLSLAVLTALALATSVFKVTLPLPAGAANMTLSYAVDFAGLLLVGPHVTAVIAAVATWAQSTFATAKRNRLNRRLFNVASVVLTVECAGLVLRLSGSGPDVHDTAGLATALTGVALTSFLINSLLVAAAVALSNGERLTRVWHDNFLWSAPSYFVSAAAVGLALSLAQREGVGLTALSAVPVYLTYVAYKVYLSRVEEEQRRSQEIERLHATALEALDRAKRSEEALIGEKDRLAVTLQSIGDGVITTDAGGRIVLMNARAEALAGREQPPHGEVAIGDLLRLRDRYTGQPVDHPVHEVIRCGELPRERRRTILHRLNQPSVMIDRSGSVVRGADGSAEGVVWVFRDVTDAVRLEQERNKASRLESLGVLAGGIAHDFNNILTGITGNLSLARMAPGLDADTGEVLSEAEAACTRAKSLTTQLLTFSKGGAPVKKTASLAEIVRETSRFALRGSNVACNCVIAADLADVEADVNQLSQVLHNLLINAKQAMPEGGTVIIEAANVTLDRQSIIPLAAGRYVRVTVTDWGVGIAEEHLGKIFDPYFTTKQNGSGLGLAACYSILRAHGGHVGVTSQVGVGTTFTIHLPASTARVVVKPLLAASASGATPHGRVLVMDDEEQLRTLATRMLQRLGYTASAVPDGEAAIVTYKAAMDAGEPFDAVLMDLTIPGGMGGAEAVGRVLELDPQAKVLVSSGYANSPTMSEYKTHGFVGVLCKPFVMADLRAALDAVVSERLPVAS